MKTNNESNGAEENHVLWVCEGNRVTPMPLQPRRDSLLDKFVKLFGTKAA